jgi:23S rRNA U2552 (ribose-2'-O)-methylase RlmE/FtsJ
MSGAGSADFFHREAQRLGYVARSAFKLLQIQQRCNFRLIAPGASVLDLGCAPGAWLQVACQHLGPFDRGGSVVGVDVKDVPVPSSHCDSRVRTLSADVMSLLKHRARALSPGASGFSVVLSDMCPSVSGITTKDAALSCQLAARALSLAVGGIISSTSDASAIQQYLSAAEADEDADEPGVLQHGGNLVIKFLENEDVPGSYQTLLLFLYHVAMFLFLFVTSCYSMLFYSILFLLVNYH